MCTYDQYHTQQDVLNYIHLEILNSIKIYEFYTIIVKQNIYIYNYLDDFDLCS